MSLYYMEQKQLVVQEESEQGDIRFLKEEWAYSGAQSDEALCVELPEKSIVESILSDGRHYTATALARMLDVQKDLILQFVADNPEIVRSTGYTSRETGELYYTSASIKPDIGEKFSRFVHHMNRLLPV